MACRIAIGSSRPGGFTLIELLVVMTIIATLLAIVAPRYFEATDRARDAALRANLQNLRQAIDHFHGDRGQYPQSLEELVQTRYLRTVPVDPITGSAEDWQLLPVPAAFAPRRPGATDSDSNADGKPSGVFDVKSSAQGTTHDGVPYDKL